MINKSLFEFDKVDTGYRIGEIKAHHARPFMERYHYSHSLGSNTKISFGLFNNEVLVGVIVYGYAASWNLMESIFEGGNQQNCLELVRMAVKDEVKYARSRFISITIKLLKKQFSYIKCLISFADLTHNHRGIVYQASNWIYTGASFPSYHYYNPLTKETFHRKSIWEKGHKIGLMESEYADRYKLEKVNHLPKHRYIYPIDKSIILKLIKQEYPK